ncbi:hypothetical protein [Sphingomonas fuzhouensis]|uniref:hypothetical protein n=1 Tax=Sphingomonas fuzhouensis TaxID=3106033 RepID=UPI002AFDD51A|nr:hypothetical protein [Sphingomonas sp. SGZ-02]
MSITMVMASEDVCLPTIGVLAEDLKRAIVPDAVVRLDLSAAASPDLSVIQLVQSARIGAAAAGCDFALSAPADAPLRALLNRAGFLPAPADDTQFWLHGETAQ